MGHLYCKLYFNLILHKQAIKDHTKVTTIESKDHGKLPCFDSKLYPKKFGRIERWAVLLVAPGLVPCLQG